MTYATETTRLVHEELGACALIQDLLPLYLEGEVSPASRDLITEHLARCQRCAGFLVGAQSVRAQLRRDERQRAEGLRQDLPQRRVVLRVRELLAGCLALLLCLPGGVAASAIGSGMDLGAVDVLLAGLVLASFVVAGLLGVARVVGPLTRARLTTLMSGIALGGAGMIVVMAFSGSPGSLIGVLTGFVVGVAGLVGVWSGVAGAGRWPFRRGN